MWTETAPADGDHDTVNAVTRMKSAAGAPGFSSIVAVDWGKDLSKRCAWVADVSRRTVKPLEGGPWYLESVLSSCRCLPGPVLLGIDAVLGVPRAYLEAASRSVPAWSGLQDFLSWLPIAVETPGFLDTSRGSTEWNWARPFFSVPKGKGALTAVWTMIGGRLMRPVDLATRAKATFIVSGIPGTVGSGTRALWTELAPLLRSDRDFGIWPLEGTLASILARRRIALAEIYPRVCYALALDDLPAPLRKISKGKAAARDRAVDALLTMPWMRTQAVNLSPKSAERAKGNEDEFDAMMSAVSILRCCLEGRLLERDGDFAVEGDMLGVGLLNLELRASGDLT